MSDDVTRDLRVEVDEDLIAAALASVEKHLVTEVEDDEPASIEDFDEIDVDPEGTLDPDVDLGDDGPALVFDPGPWGEPPPSLLDEANAKLDAAEAELEASRAVLAEATARVAAAEEESERQKERFLRLNARSKRLKEAYDRLKLRSEDDRAKLAQWEQLINEMRTAARSSERDRDRSRARHAREIDEARRFGTEGVFKELLPVLDHLDLAMSHAEGDPARTVDGIRMIVSQLERTLNRLGLARVPGGVGDPFDPQLHEAITWLPSTDVAPGHIVEVHQEGYQLHGRLVRAARVSVARPAGDLDDEPDTDELDSEAAETTRTSVDEVEE
ncbi:MAG: nucleotide exchange factor GrpE [Alphaproteobacteria bacterium]|nr:nucleotide exchange factor GrpE [Alphaproteobacteria bacterium]